jgi:hypothetical protein
VSPPPSGTAATQPALGANHEGARRDRYLSAPVYVRQGRRLVEEHGLRVSGSRLRKLVRRFVDEGRADVDFRTWFIHYADPTGETAVRNVMNVKGDAARDAG